MKIRTCKHLLFLCLTIFSIFSQAQEQDSIYPYKEVVFENANMKVFRAYHEPHEQTDFFLSAQGLNIWLTDADFEVIFPNGQVFNRFTYEKGDTNWIPAEAMVALRNLRDSPMEFYHVQMKTQENRVQREHGINKTVQTASTDLSQRMSPHVFEGEKGRIPYRLYTPKEKTDKTYPLILFLHGWGERGTDNKNQVSVGLPAVVDYMNTHHQEAYIIAPQHHHLPWLQVPILDVETFNQPATASEPLQLSIELLKTFIDEHPVDKDRIYITGLSMGAFGTWDAIARETDLFAAALPVAGGGAKDAISNIKQTPVLAIHGGMDTVVSPKFSTNTVHALRAAGATVEYMEFPDKGHKTEDFNAFYSSTKALNWLFKQKRELGDSSGIMSGSD